VRYGEGIFIGYRYYDAKEMPVLFAFGHGLSYTTFAYSAPRLSSAAGLDSDALTVSVDVTNTGKVAGKETVQVYVHDRQAGLPRPPKELKGFAKVELQPGETKTVTIPLNFRSFAYYHPAYQQWITEDGEFEILVGASASDIRGRVTLSLQSTLELPCVLHAESTVREWISDPHGRQVCDPVLQQVMVRMGKIFGSAEKPAEAVDKELLDMPLRSILHFQEDELPQPADELVEAMLAQLAQEVHGGKP
jgi:beta-glucosidase